MKTLIVIAAASLAFPVYAQQKQQDLPSAEERAQNREKVQAQAADGGRARQEPREGRDHHFQCHPHRQGEERARQRCGREDDDQRQRRQR